MAGSGGCRQSFAQLHRRLTAQLFLWASQNLRPPLRQRLDAEDLVQEIWARAYKEFARFDPRRGRFRPWLFGIAYNVLRSELRTLRSRPAAQGAPEAVDQLPGESTSVTSRLVRHEAVRELREQIDRLPREDGLLVAWRGMERLSYAEVGRRLGISAEAAESRWRRLRGRLRALAGGPSR